MDSLENVEVTDLMIEDLSGQVARKSIEVAQWKARALKAEDALERIKSEAAEAEQEQETDGV